mgnify:CR=1 FL=1
MSTLNLLEKIQILDCIYKILSEIKEPLSSNSRINFEKNDEENKNIKYIYSQTNLNILKSLSRNSAKVGFNIFPYEYNGQKWLPLKEDINYGFKIWLTIEEIISIIQKDNYWRS